MNAIIQALNKKGANMQKIIIFIFIGVLFYNCSDDNAKADNNELQTQNKLIKNKESDVREGRSSRANRPNRDSGN